MMIRQIFMLFLTVVVAIFVVIIAFKLFVGLMKLMIVGAALGIGAVIAIYLIYRIRRFVMGNHNYPQR